MQKNIGLAKDKFSDYKKAIVFGAGGYGKSTLFRHHLLRSIEREDFRDYFLRKRVFPIFVAMKTLKVGAEHPLLEAIQSTDEYLTGKSGMNRIINAAQKGVLCIYLDGYDEMPHIGGFELIKKELEIAFDSRETFFEKEKKAVSSPRCNMVNYCMVPLGV